MKTRKMLGILAAALLLVGAISAVSLAADVDIWAPDGISNPAYFVQADVVRGSKGAKGTSCVPFSEVHRGEQIVWRAEIYHQATGKVLTEDEIKATGLKVWVELKDGKTFDMKYAGHPKNPPKVNFYTAAFQVPPVYPTGILDYRIVAQDKDGNIGVYAEIGAHREGGMSSQLSVVE